MARVGAQSGCKGKGRMVEVAGERQEERNNSMGIHCLALAVFGGVLVMLAISCGLRENGIAPCAPPTTTTTP